MFWHPIYKKFTSVWENMDEGERKLCRDLVHSCEYRKDANDFQIIRGMFDLYFTEICSLEYWYMETSKPQFDVKEIPVGPRKLFIALAILLFSIIVPVFYLFIKLIILIRKLIY